MTNIGLLGDVSVGKTSILRLFVRYINKEEIENVEGGMKCNILKTDFSGEATLPGGNKSDTLNEKETKTIHPNRVVFREQESGKAHTIFAPGIATQIITVFSADRDLDPQFDFFNDVRFFPDNISVCINKIDLLEGDKEAIVENIKSRISDFFNKRKINVKEFFITCGETVDNFEDIKKYNNHVAEMILKITTSK
ncbi:MAG: hypothetical protein ACTSP9_10405 [Promethearchaeota archaeon]